MAAPNSRCWALYRGLAAKEEPDAATKAKVETALTPAELEQDEFATEEAAVLAMVRAQYLLETDPSHTPKAYVLLARGALWLAREALLREPPPPWDDDSEIGKLKDDPEIFDKCLALVRGPYAPLALTLYARAAIGKVASDEGEAATAFAEAWLLKAEVDLVYMECVAAQGKGSEVAPPPADRHPLALLMENFAGEEVPSEIQEMWNGFSRSVPGHHSQCFVMCDDDHDPFSDTRGRVYLGDYWYNMPEARAFEFIGMFQAVEKSIKKFRQVCVVKAMQDRFGARAMTVERDLHQRGGPIIDSYAGGEMTPKKEKFLNALRHVYAGSHFEPTVDFVKTLWSEPGSVWTISCMMMGNQTTLSVMDTTENGSAEI